MKQGQQGVLTVFAGLACCPALSALLLSADYPPGSCTAQDIYFFLYAGQFDRRSGCIQRFKLPKLGQLGGDPAFKLVASEVATQPKASEIRPKLVWSKHGTGVEDL